ncbi:norsolorinic acid reductase [Epithele typhae]|uniref:norsolorinic acid reductase n=1 Tax=Epithele typhae TaxID=378194 RepID=UPI002007E9F2|nr:norsolorinic acid reductase [Epithele typhae]KAH9917926.1 norsolorinic acid reductase [Epithele typhae]
MSFFKLPPPAKNELGRYRLLSPSAGVRVSPICLGTMSLGQAWSAGFAGGATQDEAFKFLDLFYDQGGNFLDTANNYQDQEAAKARVLLSTEQSEKILGEWMKARGNRDELVIATKFTIAYKNTDASAKLKVNFQGNHKKSLALSVEDSLKKLQTSYIDLLYLHMWDYSTSVPEIMQSLDALVKQGKVLYLGISDTPAWLVVKCNEYARQHGLAQFVVYQGQWNLATRDMEREIIPMCRAEGMALAPWGVVGGGRFLTEAQLAARGGAIRMGFPQTEKEKAISAALDKVARELGGGASLAGVAMAWALSKVPYVFPITGGRKPEQLQELIEALSITLSPAQIEELEKAVPFEYGFPYDFFGRDPALTDGTGGMFVQMAGHTKFVLAEKPVALGPVKSELQKTQ